MIINPKDFLAGAVEKELLQNFKNGLYQIRGDFNPVRHLKEGLDLEYDAVFLATYLKKAPAWNCPEENLKNLYEYVLNKYPQVRTDEDFFKRLDVKQAKGLGLDAEKVMILNIKGKSGLFRDYLDNLTDSKIEELLSDNKELIIELSIEQIKKNKCVKDFIIKNTEAILSKYISAVNKRPFMYHKSEILNYILSLRKDKIEYNVFLENPDLLNLMSTKLIDKYIPKDPDIWFEILNKIDFSEAKSYYNLLSKEQRIKLLKKNDNYFEFEKDKDLIKEIIVEIFLKRKMTSFSSFENKYLKLLSVNNKEQIIEQNPALISELSCISDANDKKLFLKLIRKNNSLILHCKPWQYNVIKKEELIKIAKQTFYFSIYNTYPDYIDSEALALMIIKGFDIDSFFLIKIQENKEEISQYILANGNMLDL